MKTFLIIVLCGFIFLMVGIALGDVGETPSGGVFDWWLPLAVFCFITFPAVLGFFIGRWTKE